MALRRKQVARQLSCVYAGNVIRNLSSQSDSVDMKFSDHYRAPPSESFPRVSNPCPYHPPPPTLEQISRDLYWIDENPARDFGGLGPMSRLKDRPTEAEREKAEENARKYMGLLVATENFYAGEWKSSDMTPLRNGVYPCGIGPDTIALAEYAVSYLNQQREEDNEIKLSQLIRANGQSFGFRVFWLTMEASDHKFYEAIVLVSSDRKERELKFIRPAKYYPEIPPHLHYLIRPRPGEEGLPLFDFHRRLYRMFGLAVFYAFRKLVI